MRLRGGQEAIPYANTEVNTQSFLSFQTTFGTRGKIWVYRYIAAFVSQYNDILYDTVKCKLADL